jgi:pimeloyl-ACP methyl ester carboxylesterase
MNTHGQAGDRFSRRSLIAATSGLAAASTLTPSVRAQAHGTPEATPRAASLDDQLAWVLATLNDGASALTVEEVTAHFDADFLAAVPPEFVIGFVQQATATFGTVSLDGFTRARTETQANALLTSGSGLPLVVPISVEAAPPQLITGINFAPVPPPSGVELVPTVDAAGTPVAASGRRDGLVDVDGRDIYLSTLGTGGPTVVLESGANDSAAPWFAIESAVASFTRVCSYDRANTVAGASDPAPVPRTGEDLVADLHALLVAADEPGPYVLVGHSIGGHVIRLYASTYPDEVAGLVLVDASHEQQFARLQEMLSPEQWAAMQQMIIGIEGLDLEAMAAQVRDARAEAPLEPMPLVVLSAGQGADPATLPPDWPVEEYAALWAELQEDLAGLVPGSRHVVAEQSGHYIHQSQPDLVVEAIRAVVTAVQDPGTWATPGVATPAA